MRLLLDTNAYTELMRGTAAVADRVRGAQRILMSAVVVGELLYGFRHGRHYEANRRQLDEFLAQRLVDFLPVTFTTADRFGLVAADLRRRGIPIPLNDIWIAAHSLETGADLLTNDAHFERVPGLSTIRWSPPPGAPLPPPGGGDV